MVSCSLCFVGLSFSPLAGGCYFWKVLISLTSPFPFVCFFLLFGFWKVKEQEKEEDTLKKTSDKKRWEDLSLDYVRSEKLQNESFPNVRIFFPNFALNFAPDFPQIFKEFSCFVSWETETRKIHLKSPPFYHCKTPREVRRKIHKTFLESEQSKIMKNNDNNENVMMVMRRMK